MVIQQQHKPLSVLVIGASGRTGTLIMQQLSNNDNTQVHAFCRDPTKFDDKSQTFYHSIVKGNALNSHDLQNAIETTNANVVVVSIANGDSLKKTNLRTASAQALAQVLEKQNFQHVKVVVISSSGAGTSHIKVGFGVGKVVEHVLRHILADHDGQEAAMAPFHDRSLIVRPTGLTDGNRLKYIVEFGDNDKCPTMHIDRSNVAEYVSERIVGGNNYGRIVNITGSKKLMQ